MEEEDIEECIKRVNAVDNGIMIYTQNLSQKMENLKNVKKKFVDKLVDYKVFIGSDPSKEEKEKRFKDVEYVARDFKNQVKSLFDPDAGTKKFIDTIDRELEALTNQINGYKNTLKDIEKYIKNNPSKKDKKKEETKKEEKKKAGPEKEPVKTEPKKEDVKKEEPKKEEVKKEEPKIEEPKKEEPKKEEPKKEEPKKEEIKKEEVKKEEPKKEEAKKEEPKKEEVKKEEPKKEEAKKEEPKKEVKKKAGPEREPPKKAGPEREPPQKESNQKEEPRSDVRFMSNIPLYLGSILPQEPSYIVNHPERKDEILIGFKTGSCALGQLKGRQLAVSQDFPLKLGQIKNILICQGNLCNGAYLVAAEKKKSISLVYPTVEKGVLSMNQMLLTKMEEENPSLIEVGGQGKIFLTEFKKRDICAYCKNYIFLWKEKNGKFELHKINLEDDIESLIQVGGKILVLSKRKNKFILIDLSSLEQAYYDISEHFKISLRDDSSLIQLSNEYFLVDNGIKYDLFKYDTKINYLKSFGKNASHIENYQKINNDTFILCEYFDGKRFFSKYKFSNQEGEVKFEIAGGPYMFDAAQRLQSFCVLGDELLTVVEKGSKKIYVFQI